MVLALEGSMAAPVADVERLGDELEGEGEGPGATPGVGVPPWTSRKPGRCT